MSVSTWVDGGGERSLIERMSLRPYLVVRWSFKHSKNIRSWFKTRVHEMCCFDWSNQKLDGGRAWNEAITDD